MSTLKKLKKLRHCRKRHVSSKRFVLRPLSYKHCVVWDLSKAYNFVHTTEQETHLRRLVWRWGYDQSDWLSFSLTRMHFGDRYAMCGLEVSKTKVADLGQHIDSEAVAMIKMTYVDDGSGGGTTQTVDRLIGEESTDPQGNLTYTGTVAQIFALGGFTLKVIVEAKEGSKLE